MNKTLKRMVALMLSAVLLVSLSVNTFAASASYKKNGCYYSEELVDVICNYYSLKKDGFTVKNNGTVAVYVYKNGAIEATVYPGKSYTSKKTHSFKDRVQVYAVQKSIGTQKISITSTSGVIYKA